MALMALKENNNPSAGGQTQITSVQHATTIGNPLDSTEGGHALLNMNTNAHPSKPTTTNVTATNHEHSTTMRQNLS